MRDEVSTDGCGMAIIELMTMCGIACQDSNDNMTWELHNDYDTKMMHLTGDGLNSERFKSFKQKLKRIPQSFARNFKQSLMFQKALDRVIDSSGTLHMSFYILQLLYIMFRVILEWDSDVLQLKKINMKCVSVLIWQRE